MDTRTLTSIGHTLKGSALFSNLDEQQLSHVVTFSRRRQLKSSEVLFEAGDRASHFYLVVTGQIKLTRLAANGNEKVIELIVAGQTFAEALMFADTPRYPVTATAIEASEVIAIDNQPFIAMLRGSVDTCFRIMSEMSLRLHKLIKEIDELTLQSAIGRAAGYLLRLGQRDGVLVEEFTLDAPKGIIASRLSIKPETLSRLLAGFTSQGLITVAGSRITITDHQGLAALAASSSEELQR